MAETILEHELEEKEKPCLLFEAMQKQALYGMAMFFKPIRKAKKSKKLGPYKVTPSMQKRMQNMREQRLPNGILRYTIADIARCFNVSQGTVKNHTIGTRPGRTGISAETQDQIKYMIQQGYTQQHVADSLGISKSSVERYG